MRLDRSGMPALRPTWASEATSPVAVLSLPMPDHDYLLLSMIATVEEVVQPLETRLEVPGMGEETAGDSSSLEVFSTGWSSEEHQTTIPEMSAVCLAAFRLLCSQEVLLASPMPCVPSLSIAYIVHSAHNRPADSATD